MLENHTNAVGSLDHLVDNAYNGSVLSIRKPRLAMLEYGKKGTHSEVEKIKTNLSAGMAICPLRKSRQIEGQ